MKYPLLFLFSLLPAFLTSSQETFKTITMAVDTHEDFASLDDVAISLGGTVTFDEETSTYIYVINDQEIKLNLDYGYSLVNGEKEALVVETNEETNIRTIHWQTPMLIEDEIFVPIQYIERVLNATYEENIFTFHIKEIIDEEVVEQEEVVAEETDEVENPANSSTTNSSKPNQSTQTQKPSQTPSKPGSSESKPQQTPTTPNQPESKPENIPSKPESEAEDVNPSIPPQSGSKPENITPPIPSQPESKPDDPVIEPPKEEETPSVDPEEIPSPDLPSDPNLENPASDIPDYENSNDLEIIE